LQLQLWRSKKQEINKSPTASVAGLLERGDRRLNFSVQEGCCACCGDELFVLRVVPLPLQFIALERKPSLVFARRFFATGAF
jgi:hypothetical protein